MASVNKKIVLGRLGQDPKQSFTKSGNEVSNFSVATYEKIKRNDVYEEETDWHRVAAFGAQAKFINEYCKKGTLVYIEGKDKNREYKNKDGETIKFNEMIVYNVQLTKSKNSEQ